MNEFHVEIVKYETLKNENNKLNSLIRSQRDAKIH